MSWVRLALLGLLAFGQQSCFGGGGITPVRTAFNRGVYHHAAGELDAAIDEYRQALVDDAADHRARFNLALAHEERGAAGDRDIARAEYEAILRDRPDDLRAGVNLAALLHDQGSPDGVARLEAMIDAHPDAVLPRVSYATHLLRSGDAAAAVALLEPLSHVAPADGQLHLLLGDARRRAGDAAGARTAYEVAVRRDTGRPAALLALAELDQEAGDPAAAWDRLTRLLVLDPDHGPAHALRARLAEAAGDLEAAVFHLWRARDLDPDLVPEVRGRLAALYRSLLRGADPTALPDAR